MRTTHTFATLPVSAAAFDEIAQKLRAADYDHAFVEEYIDMHGIALERESAPDPRSAPPQAVPAIREAHEHLKESIKCLKDRDGGGSVPDDLYHAAHALYHAIEDAPDCKVLRHHANETLEEQEYLISAAEPQAVRQTISLQDPRVIIAGIRQFGLAPDGSDLRDLKAALSRSQAESASDLLWSSDEMADMYGIALEREAVPEPIADVVTWPTWCSGCSRYVEIECHHFHCPVKP